MKKRNPVYSPNFQPIKYGFDLETKQFNGYNTVLGSLIDFERKENKFNRVFEVEDAKIVK